MITLPVKYPDFASYEEYIGAYGNFNALDKTKMDRIMNMFAANLSTCEKIMGLQLSFLCGGYNTVGTSLQKIPELLIGRGVPENIFKSYKNKSNYSFDKEVRGKLKEYLVDGEFSKDSMLNILSYMMMYDDKALYASVISSMKKNKELGIVSEVDIPMYGGSEAYQIANIYVRQMTGRYYAREASIVQLPLLVRQCFVAPKDYFYLCMDLKQIDIRVAYNMYLLGYYPDDDKIFIDEKKDKYKAIYKIACIRAKTPYDEEFFVDNRAGIKTSILAAMYGAHKARLMQIVKDDIFTSTIHEYFEKHEGYQWLIGKITKLYDLNLSLFRVKDFFGFEIDIEVCENLKHSEVKYPLEQVIKWVISRTVQATSNSIVVNWTNDVMRKMEDAGHDISVFRVGMQRHDELDFVVHNSIMDQLDPVFNSLSIQIADWDLIEFDTEVFIHYKSEAEDFEGEEQLLKEYRYRIDVYLNKDYPKVPRGERVKNRCIPNVHEIYVISVDPPETLAKTIFALPQKLSREDSIEKIVLAAAKGMLNPIMINYREMWNIYILKNTISNQWRAFHGLEGINETLAGFNIGVVKVKDIFGNGPAMLGDIMVSRDDSAQDEVASILKSAVGGLKNEPESSNN